jgi:tripartite-type tricarboxylate transporter receptor subunit TctC
MPEPKSVTMTRAEFARLLAAAILSSLTGTAPARAAAQGAGQGVAAFYRGRTITLIVPTTPGGINDLSGRLVARHLGRFIPGNPAIAAENREEGGGLRLANRFANAPANERDGATIAIIQRGIPQLAIQGDRFAKFDPLALNWLGSLSSFSTDAYILVVASRHPAKTVADLALPAVPALIGGDTPGSTNLTFALVARDALKLNIDVKDGFKGAAGMFFAMGQGDLDGQVVGLNSIRANQTALWNAGEFRALLQFGRSGRHPLLPDVPLASELTRDKAALDIIAFTEAPLYMALPFLAPSGIPEVRLAALRTAFMAMVKDKDFLADAEKSKLDITPIDAGAVRAIIAKMAATPEDVIERYNRIVNI